MATNKYTDIEIQTAKKLLEHGYKWIARDESGSLFAYTDKPRKWSKLLWSDGRRGSGICYVCEEFVPIFQNVTFVDKEPVSLEAIVHPQILDDAERRYLSAVIRPFRDSARGIEKAENLPYEMICIDTKYRYMVFPPFDKGTMYKGMKPDHGYTLEELGL